MQLNSEGKSSHRPILYLKTQRTTGNNWQKKHTHRFKQGQLHKLEQLSPYLKHLHLPVHALVHPHLVNSQQLSNRWKWCPEDFPLLVLFHPSPVGWARHLWLSLQGLSPQVSIPVRSVFGMLFECCLSWWDQVILSLLPGKEIKHGLVHSCDITGPVIY